MFASGVQSGTCGEYVLSIGDVHAPGARAELTETTHTPGLVWAARHAPVRTVILQCTTPDSPWRQRRFLLSWRSARPSPVRIVR